MPRLGAHHEFDIPIVSRKIIDSRSMENSGTEASCFSHHSFVWIDSSDRVSEAGYDAGEGTGSTANIEGPSRASRMIDEVEERSIRISWSGAIVKIVLSAETDFHVRLFPPVLHDLKAIYDPSTETPKGSKRMGRIAEKARWRPTPAPTATQ